MEVRFANGSVVLPLLLCRATGPELAQSRRQERDVRCHSLVVSTRHRRIPARRGRHSLRGTKLTDNPVIPGKKNAFGDPVERRINNTKLPELHDALKGLRAVADEYEPS